ncbi:MAG: T9SS type A sorting domain-containing protein [Bacteroidota bacterium]
MKIFLTFLVAIFLFSTCKKDDEIYTTKNAIVTTQPIVDTSFTLSCFPNPCDSFLNIQIKLTQASALKILIYNLNGRMVYQSTTTIQLAAGQSTIGVDVHSLLSGLYILRCEFDTWITNKKIIKN